MQNIKSTNEARKAYENSALLWLQVAQDATRAGLTGAREMALGLASAHMDAADACVVPAVCVR